MLEDDQTADIADILAHLAAEGLSRYDMPEFWIPVSDLPIMTTGKLDKTEIQRRVRAGELSAESVA